MEGKFSKALLLRRKDGSEVVAKIPFPIAGPAKYTTASEVAVLKYLHTHTQVPVPKVLTWDADSSNPVGAEYIIMEKAPGVKLSKVCGEMRDWDRFCLVEKLAEFESQMANIRFPANGSLYLTKSMAESDTYIALDRDMDPTGKFCIGPSCERGWQIPGDTAVQTPHPNQGPWPNLSSFGIALVEREAALLGKRSPAGTSGTPRVSLDEQIAILNMTKEVMCRLDERTLIGRFSEPVLWHTDLHMDNIYVSEKNPADIVSLMDWRSIVVSPLFLQARFPEFLEVDEDYPLGIIGVPELPPNFEEMDVEEKICAKEKVEEIRIVKNYEFQTGIKTDRAYAALKIPRFLTELFICCGQASEKGVIPLRQYLFQYGADWEELGFEGECPIDPSEEDLEIHDQQFEEYRNYHKVHEWARKLLQTDSEGWIAPEVDFESKQKTHKELLEMFVCESGEFGMTPERMREIWPYLERP